MRLRAAAEGLLRLAEALHSRVMADDVVSHAFSHGFHPQHTERLGVPLAEQRFGRDVANRSPTQSDEP
jgi:hypothetical protein